MESIEIKGFKSIKNAKVELAPINILIGANGAGKSNFISFFEFLDSLYNKKLQEYVGLRGGIEKFLHKGTQPSTSIEGQIKFTDGINAYSFKIEKTPDTFAFTNEILWYNNDPLVYHLFEKEASVKNNTWYRAKFIQKFIQGHKKYHFHDTGKDSPFNSTTNIDNDSLELYSRGENIAPILSKIKERHPKIYNRIIKTIQQIAPYFLDFVLQPNENGFIKLYWRDKYSEYVYGVSDFSDGTIRFIALAVLFMQPKLPDTIIIDEPELGLHPQAIGYLSGLIHAASTQSQIIIATQSAELISDFEPEDIICVDQKDGMTEFSRLNSESLSVWLADYSMGDLWRQNIISKAQPFSNL